MTKEEIELIDGFFNKGWCCDLDEVYKAVMKLQNNWNKLKKWLEDDFYMSYYEEDLSSGWVVEIIKKKMQELEKK